MGKKKSKSNTGIGFIDDAVDTVVNDGVNRAVENVESAAQRVGNGLGEIASGNLNNVGNTLLEIGAIGLTGGASAALGYKAGETATERRVREFAEKTAGEEAVKAAADAKAADDKRLGDINNVIMEMVGSRRRQPGRAATLLTTVGAGNSYGPLLTGSR